MSESAIIDQALGQAQTTDNSTATILSYDLSQGVSNNFSAQVNLIVVAKNVDNGDTFCTMSNFSAKSVDGSTSIVGDIIPALPIQSDLSLALASIGVGVSGSNIVIYGTGVVLTNIDWWAKLSINGIQSS